MDIRRNLRRFEALRNVGVGVSCVGVLPSFFFGVDAMTTRLITWDVESSSMMAGWLAFLSYFGLELLWNKHNDSRRRLVN